MSGKIDFSNPAKLSGSGGIFAGAGFLLDFRKSAGFRPEPEPKSGSALHKTPYLHTSYGMRVNKWMNQRSSSITDHPQSVPSL